MQIPDPLYWRVWVNTYLKIKDNVTGKQFNTSLPKYKNSDCKAISLLHSYVYNSANIHITLLKLDKKWQDVIL